MFEDLLINYWAVLGASVAGMVIGMLWYSPFLFGKTWMRLSGCTAEQMEKAKQAGMTKSYIGAFLCNVVASLAIAFFLDRVGAYDLVEGLIVAVVAWAGFTLTTLFSGLLWEKKPLPLFLINAGHYLVFFCVASVILMLFP